MEQTLKGMSQPTRIIMQRDTMMIDTTGPTPARDDNSDGCLEAYYQQPVNDEPTIHQEPDPVVSVPASHKWENKLALKSIATAAHYKPYIKAFIKEKGNGGVFVQDDVDDYFFRMQ